MVDFHKKNWNEIEDKITQIYREEISLMDEMIESVKNNYQPNKMTLFRKMCFGVLIICRDNQRAALLLIKENLIHQIHYISRNMFEMIVNLYFIDNEDSKRQELVERFFAYRIVDAFNTLKIMRRYPSIPQSNRTEENDKYIEEAYSSFKDKYKNAKGKIDLNTWSGMKLPEMIKSISDIKLSENLMTGYDIMTKTNNRFLHLSNEYLNIVIRDEYEKITDHQMVYTQLSSLMISAGLIIKKYFVHFQKNRPVLKRKYDDIERRHDELAVDAKEIVEYEASLEF